MTDYLMIKDYYPISGRSRIYKFPLSYLTADEVLDLLDSQYVDRWWTEIDSYNEHM